MDVDLAVQLACLEIRRFFKDIPQFAIDKKSNFEYLEKEIGLHKFLPASVIASIKHKHLRKQIQSQFKSISSLDESQCMLRFLELVQEVLHFKEERYKCEFGVCLLTFIILQLIANVENVFPFA